MAEPAVDLVEFGPKFIEQHKIDVIPLQEDDHHEKLRAYNARIELLNSIFHPEQHDFDWQIASIDRHLTKQIPNQNQRRIYYKVTWFGGKSQWINQDYLRLHDPYLFIRYASGHNLI